MSGSWGRKDAFPGADGSTIKQTTNDNATTIYLYGSDGSSILEEDKTGFKKVLITELEVLYNNTAYLYAIKHPLSFISNSIPPNDWYTTEVSQQDDNLWGDRDIKSNNDPCPKGWRVPQANTWKDFTTITFLYYITSSQMTSGDRTGTNGRLYNDFVWYPAEGYRSYYPGALNGVGGNGSCWSSTPNDRFSEYLLFNMDEVTYNNRNGHSGGFSVRCIQE